MIFTSCFHGFFTALLGLRSSKKTNFSTAFDRSSTAFNRFRPKMSESLKALSFIEL
jgi:hypothetical protein